MTIAFRKGHGTGNDFVIIDDPDGRWDLTPRLVAALCHRRFGIGADGVLRVVRDGDEWFMDYRNSDGTLAEMCGNGARVFAQHLADRGWVTDTSFPILTRGGRRLVRREPDGRVTVWMGAATEVGDVAVSVGDRTWPAVGTLVPNPHAVAVLPTLSGLGDITDASAGPAAVFPDGANVEFAEIKGPDRIAMRVWERGSGETLSCGTGACAVAHVHHVHHGGADRITVEVPGGELEVTLGDDLALTGPTEFVAEGHVDPQWWQAHR
ncbi:MAG: diaminopimelate epimerase [Candidatus Nanopelagicales bacterium]